MTVHFIPAQFLICLPRRHLKEPRRRSPESADRASGFDNIFARPEFFRRRAVNAVVRLAVAVFAVVKQGNFRRLTADFRRHAGAFDRSAAVRQLGL